MPDIYSCGTLNMSLSVHCRKDFAEPSKKQLSLALWWNDFWVWQESVVEDWQLHTEIRLATEIQQRIMSEVLISILHTFNTVYWMQTRLKANVIILVWTTPEKMPFMLFHKLGKKNKYTSLHFGGQMKYVSLFSKCAKSELSTLCLKPGFN